MSNFAHTLNSLTFIHGNESQVTRFSSVTNFLSVIIHNFGGHLIKKNMCLLTYSYWRDHWFPESINQRVHSINRLLFSLCSPVFSGLFEGLILSCLTVSVLASHICPVPGIASSEQSQYLRNVFRDAWVRIILPRLCLWLGALFHY